VARTSTSIGNGHGFVPAALGATLFGILGHSRSESLRSSRSSMMRLHSFVSEHSHGQAAQTLTVLTRCDGVMKTLRGSSWLPQLLRMDVALWHCTGQSFGSQFKGGVWCPRSTALIKRQRKLKTQTDRVVVR